MFGNMRQSIGTESRRFNHIEARSGGACAQDRGTILRSMAEEKTGRRHRVLVNREWCKGCTICVAFCPTHVLGMDGHEKAVVLKAEACTGCRLCELRCPDLAITVASEDGGGDG